MDESQEIRDIISNLATFVNKVKESGWDPEEITHIQNEIVDLESLLEILKNK